MAISLHAERNHEIVGKPVLTEVIGEFFERVAEDEALRGFFDQTDIARLKALMVAFLSMALDGPNEYDGMPMSEAHHELGISGEEFDRFEGHLVSTLQNAGVDAQQFVELFETLKVCIVTR